jgi:hypothetical protein
VERTTTLIRAMDKHGGTTDEADRIPTGDVVDRNDPETTRDQRFPW